MRKRRKFLKRSVILTLFLAPLGFFYYGLQNFEEPPRLGLEQGQKTVLDECPVFKKDNDLWPKCQQRYDEVDKLLRSKSCKIANFTNCPILTYLSDVEEACPGPKIQANLDFELETVLAKFATNPKIYTFLKTRISSFWPDWVEAARSLQQELAGRQKLKIVMFFGFLANEATLRMADGSGKGGPQGELVQWSDLLATLTILGHDVEIASTVEEMRRIISRMGRHATCPRDDGDAPPTLRAHLIITDIMGFHRIPTMIRNANRCRLRVLDSFGTHAEFVSRRDFVANSRKYQGTVRKRNPWGGLGLRLEQHWTYYPHSQDNTFLGFVVRRGDDATRPKSRGKLKALVYGKVASYWKESHEQIAVLQEFAEVHATVADGDFAWPNVVNHGLLSASEIRELYSRVDIFFGLGFPFEGPAPLEAIANGAIFINPRFATPQSRRNNAFLGDKPTLREFASQNPYAAERIGEPYVRTVNIWDAEELRETLRDIASQEKRLAPFVPDEFTNRGMLRRVAKLVENQRFCHMQNVGSRRIWPPLASLQIVLGDAGKSCEQACDSRQLVCERRFFEAINTEKIVKKNSSCVEISQSASYSAPFACHLQSDASHFSCATIPDDATRRICPCRDFQFQQLALCKLC